MINLSSARFRFLILIVVLAVAAFARSQIRARVRNVRNISRVAEGGGGKPCHSVTCYESINRAQQPECDSHNSAL